MLKGFIEKWSTNRVEFDQLVFVGLFFFRNNEVDNYFKDGKLSLQSMGFPASQFKNNLKATGFFCPVN